MIIYKVTNKQDGKIYIGQTYRQFKTRRAEHLRASANISRSRNPTPLQLAISSYGSGSFTWEILETCTSIKHLNEREIFYIKLLNTMVPNGYNQTKGGTPDKDISIQIREKISNSMVKVHQDPSYQARVYPKLKGLVPPNKGISITEEQRLKVSEAGKARYQVPGYVNPNVGQKRTEEHKANIKAGQKGKLQTGEAWNAIHKDQYTPEAKAKMRAAKIGKKPANTKQVLCVETGQVFNGLTDASIALGINRQSIFLQIKGKLKSAGGKHFQYVEKECEQNLTPTLNASN